MPLQNRVTPDGEIIATTARGTMMGNRGGCFHRPDRTLGRRRWATRQWIACRLAFKGRRRRVMSPGLYTELFFLDEATALSAGHRPCFECRREDATRFATLWAALGGRPTRAPAGEMDVRLHAERVGGQTWTTNAGALPPGAFVRLGGAAHLVLDDVLLRWTVSGYGVPTRVDPSSRLEVLTPPSIVAVLSAGFSPMVHSTARGSIH